MWFPFLLFLDKLLPFGCRNNWRQNYGRNIKLLMKLINFRIHSTYLSFLDKNQTNKFNLRKKKWFFQFTLKARQMCVEEGLKIDVAIHSHLYSLHCTPTPHHPAIEPTLPSSHDSSAVEVVPCYKLLVQLRFGTSWGDPISLFNYL